MIRKFECKKCHKLFEVDDQGEVRCPDCGSDNVDFAHSHISSKVWKWAAIAIAVIGIAVILVQTDWNRHNVSVSEYEITSSDSDSTKKYIDTPRVEPVPLPEPPKVEVDKLDYEDSGYSFTVKVKNEPTKPYYIAVVEHNGTKVIAKSNDGKQFQNVPPAEQEEGMYDIVLFDAGADTVMSVPLPVPGFIRQNTVAKMTKEQLQKLINDEDEMLFGINDYILPDCQIHFTNLPKDISQKPTSLADAMGKTGFLWSGLTVSSLEYDDKNRISAITLTVQPLDE